MILEERLQGKECHFICLVVKPRFCRVINLTTTFSLLAKSERVYENNILGLPVFSATSASSSQHDRGTLGTRMETALMIVQ